MTKSVLRLLTQTGICFLLGTRAIFAAGILMDDSAPLRMPQVGDHQLRLLSPTLLEVTMVTTKNPDPAPVTSWNFVDTNINLTLPPVSDFTVEVNGAPVPVSSLGFKRRVIYAPLKVYDMRVGNYLYIQLASPVASGSVIQVLNPPGDLWDTNTLFTLTVDPLRYSPAIHVNQVGYLPALSKTAMVGYYLGSLGELSVSNLSTFQIVDAASGATVYQGNFVPHPDIGWLYTPDPYQQVLEADFSPFTTPGEYKLVVPGLGASFPFLIDSGVAGTIARTYELGIYHQRCGTALTLPYTRFTHGVCHDAPPTVPLSGPSLTFVNSVLADNAPGGTNDPDETAPIMTNIWASLYPYVNTNAVNTRGGHHDAGDYSKYTTSVANFIHNLVFTVDNFPGAASLDNLGIPESGDGISDILQEAKWEADYLVNLQDADGGFYFIVYPATRTYESNVTPDHGDPQIVLPKNTACTAAAVGALADIASSPAFKAAYPTVASNYLATALRGWTFLTNAITKYGRNGAYQTITFSGDWEMHNDELAWAAAALYTATGDPQFDTNLRTYTPNPNDPSLRRWGWWGMYGCYGNAYRDYAFAARSGRLQTNQLNAAYVAACNNEILNQGTNEVEWAQEDAYGSSFAEDNKGSRTAGWYFSGEQTFDLAVAYLVNPQPVYLDTILQNYNYEMGCNPLNVSFLTGTGWKRQREIVHQYAQNSYQVLPPTGIPLGNIQQGYYWTTTYQTVLEEMSYPNDFANSAPYPMYDRWADTFNVTTEFIVSQETTRSLPAAAMLMAMSGLSTQTWNSAVGQIASLPAVSTPGQPVTATLSVTAGIDLTSARIVWEAQDQEPYIGTNFTFTPKYAGSQWVEVEAQLKDGRRIFSHTNFTAALLDTNTIAAYQSIPLASNTNVVAWYTFDGTYGDQEVREANLVPSGAATIDQSSFDNTNDPSGGALRVYNVGDQVTVTIPNADVARAGTTALSIEAMFYINGYVGYGVANANIFALTKSWNTGLTLQQNIWNETPAIIGGVNTIMPSATIFQIPGAWRDLFVDDTNYVVNYSTLSSTLAVGQWQHLKIQLDTNGYSVFINGALVVLTNSTDLQTWPGTGTLTLTAGNFDGWIDDIVIKSVGAGSLTSTTGSGGTTTNTTPTIPSAPPATTTVLSQGTNYQANPVTPDSTDIALYHLDNTLADATGQQTNLTLSGNAQFDSSNLSWMPNPSGAALKLLDIGDQATVTLTNVAFYQPGQTEEIGVEAMVYANAYTAYSRQSVPILSLSKRWDDQLILNQNTWGYSPQLIGGNALVIPASTLVPYLKTNCWQKIGIYLDGNGYSVRVDDAEVARVASGDLTNWTGTGSATLTFGNFNGWIDEVAVRSSTTAIPVPQPPAPPTPPVLPTVSVVASSPDASDSGTPGAFTFSLSSSATTPITVNYTLGGSAQSGANYVALGSSITIPAGATNATLSVQPLNGGVFTGPLTVTLTLATNAAYQVGASASDTVTIADINRPTISILYGNTGSSSTLSVAPPPSGQPAPSTPLQISAVAVPGIAYLVQCSTDLVSWGFIYTNQISTPLAFSDSATTGVTNRFYRVLFVTSLSAPAIASALANGNFSANAVGFVNLTVPPGYSLIANPLDTTNNAIGTLFSSVPLGCEVLEWTGAKYTIDQFSPRINAWSFPNTPLYPGQGAFFFNSASTNLVIPFAGQLFQGALTNSIPAGYSIHSSLVPQNGPVDSLLGFPVADGASIMTWSNGAFVTDTYSATRGTWSATGATGPAIAIGQSFFVNQSYPTNWVRSFSITQ